MVGHIGLSTLQCLAGIASIRDSDGPNLNLNASYSCHSELWDGHCAKKTLVSIAAAANTACLLSLFWHVQILKRLTSASDRLS